MSKKEVWSETQKLQYKESRMSGKFTATSLREFMKNSKMEEGFDFGIMGKTAWVYDYNSMQMLNFSLKAEH